MKRKKTGKAREMKPGVLSVVAAVAFGVFSAALVAPARGFDVQLESETCTRASGDSPKNEPGWTAWEPLGVSPGLTVYRGAAVVWKRRRLPPDEEPPRPRPFALFGGGFLPKDGEPEREVADG